MQILLVASPSWDDVETAAFNAKLAGSFWVLIIIINQ